MYARRLNPLLLLWLLSFFTSCSLLKVPEKEPRLIPVGEGWANNSVNTVIFRRNSLATHRNMQYAAYYDQAQHVVLARRKHGTDKWELHRTPYTGRATDAHNSISIMVDGKGYLHISWDHHGNQLRYARSLQPGSLELGDEMPMTGLKEDNVTYPEFYRMPDGKLLFLYRYGASGMGDLVINQYDPDQQVWTQLQHNLIDGEGERNAYWQAFVDGNGTIHLSWVWRESWDVASNHDMCYARSKDGGLSWENSKGEKYSLPINVRNAEIAYAIPQNSELINQTSMSADSRGNPVIASYWREPGSQIPQYHIIYHDGEAWQRQQVSSRTMPFSLSGGGTKRIPISRPQVLLQSGKKTGAYLLFRDAERGNKVSAAISPDFPNTEWQLKDLSELSVGSWEPTYDTEYWKGKGILNIFVQKVEQPDNEGVANTQPQMVYVLEWEPSEH